VSSAQVGRLSGWYINVMLHKKRIMRFLKIISIVVFSFLANNNLLAQNPVKNDSIKVAVTITRFYDWYLKAIKENRKYEFEPMFSKTSTGMTSLDFSVYIKNLKKFRFSDPLISREQESYKICCDSLINIKHSDFEIRYNDLSDFEQIQCDFSNSYRWIGGQDPVDRISISNIQFQNSTLAIATINKMIFSSETNEFVSSGEIRLILIKTDNVWKIDDIKWL
jgi:hypothetical protein